MTRRLGDLARLVGGAVEGDEHREIDGVSTLEQADERHLAFLTNPRYLAAARSSRAGALLVAPGTAGLDRDLLVVENPYLALARILEDWHPRREAAPGIDPTARIHETARIDERASIGAYCCVGEGSVVGSGAVLHPHVVVGRDCHVGPGTVLHPMAVLYDGTLLGSDVIVHAGVVLGADGYGFARSSEGHHKIPHVGRVVVEDDVEIGANSTIDRAMLHETRIGRGTKIDNLVMVGHNVRIGERCLLVAQFGIAGSSTLGNDVVAAGQSGVMGHVQVGDGVQLVSKSALFDSVGPGERLAGIPAVDSMTWRRQQVRLRRLGEMEKRLKRLERKLDTDRSDPESHV